VVVVVVVVVVVRLPQRLRLAIQVVVIFSFVVVWWWWQTGGLQVRKDGGEGGGEWYDVIMGPEKVCVVVGATLEHATGGALRATEHRVVAIPQEDGSSGGGSNDDQQQARLSVVMRMRAGDDMVWNPLSFATMAPHLETPRLAGIVGKKTMTVEQLMKDFDSLRISINKPPPPPPTSTTSFDAAATTSSAPTTFDSLPHLPLPTTIATTINGTTATSSTQTDDHSEAYKIVICLYNGQGHELYFKVRRKEEEEEEGGGTGEISHYHQTD